MIIWKPFRNTRYNISSDGRVFSKLSNKELRPIPDGRGYLAVSLWVDGEMEKYKIHRLVAEVFIENPNNLLEVNHKDGNRHNNTVENLEWLSHSDNMKHAWETGLMCRGSECSISVLNEESVVEIKYMFLKGLTNQDIAEIFGVARGTISKIRQKKTWKHVLPELEYEAFSITKFTGKKLTPEDIPKIRSMYREGASLAEIGRIYGVHSGTISGVVSGKTWTNY